MILYKLTEQQISSQLGEETVILDHEKGVYFGLNEVGTHIWTMLEKEPRDFQTLKESILATFDVDDKTCEEDLKTLLDKLMLENLVEII